MCMSLRLSVCVELVCSWTDLVKYDAISTSIDVLSSKNQALFKYCMHASTVLKHSMQLIASYKMDSSLRNT